MNTKRRLDQQLVHLKLLPTRSQAESYIKLGKVTVDTKVVVKPGFLVSDDSAVTLTATEQYVSRAGLKLASVAKVLKLNFVDKVVLDVGSSTGGFTDYALQHGATKVIAIEVGTDQLHPSLHADGRIELHEKTDIRNVHMRVDGQSLKPDVSANPQFVFINDKISIVVADVSFISLRLILPDIAKLCTKDTKIVVMLKPQFEAAGSTLKHKGVIKNDKMRRDILKDFEAWASHYFRLVDKADSEVAGAKGNRERFYLLQKLV